jgi:flavocytochrome c
MPIYTSSTVDWLEQQQLVIVGAGACGLIAALAAAQHGVRVLLLEKADKLTGNTTRSTGLIPAANTRFQRQAGVLDDSPQLMASDILSKNHDAASASMTNLLCERSAGLVEWLADDIGCDIICHTNFLYPGQSRLRMHGPSHGYGAELSHQLVAAIEADPYIELRMGTPVRDLLWDGMRVIGVQIDAGAIKAKAVILALDGFGANHEMVGRYLGAHVASALYFGSANNVGEGIRWGMELGAAVAHMDAYQGHASVAAPDGPLVTWGTIVNGAILVNRDARRFGNELQGYSEYASIVLAQPGGEAWEVFDQKVYDRSLDTRLQEVIAANKVIRGETLQGLAQRFGLPTTSLIDTVAEVNAAILHASADAYGRQEFLSGLLEPPFYGIHVYGALFHTQGGLKIDALARVLRPDGRIIPGLYAGGGTAVGISGGGVEGYSTGNGLLAASALGKIAGEAAADEIAS